MATTKLYLDTRKAKNNGTFPLKLSICKNGKASQLSLNIYLLKEQWDSTACKVTKHPNKSFLNSFIMRRQAEAEQFILKLRDEGKMMDYNSTRLRDEIKAIFDPVPSDRINMYDYIVYNSNLKKKSTTQLHYISFANLFKEYEKNYQKVYFEDITVKWLQSFIKYLRNDKMLSENSIVAYFRVFKTCFNQAIDEELTTNYPFKRIKIKMSQTKKRNLTVDELRYIFQYFIPKKNQKYIDAFKLQFLLIGINIYDLAMLPDTITKDGRIEYYRAKTNKLYSIKVEHEALEIINKYRDGEYLFPLIKNRKGTSLHTFSCYMNKVLKGIKSDKYDFSELTTYYSRHSWATIAHEIGIAKDTISLALGHSFGVSVTDTYIDYNLSKIDEANRKVIDYVLYNKKGEGK